MMTRASGRRSGCRNAACRDAGARRSRGIETRGARGMDMQENERMKPTTFLRDEDGIMAVVFAMLLPVFIVLAALAIDMGYAYWKRNILQVDASATALAGAGYLLDDVTVTLSGIWKYNLVDVDGDGVPDNLDLGGPGGVGVPDGVPDGAAVLMEAIYYSNQNIDAAEEVLAVEDFVPGNWDPFDRIFTRSGTWDPISLMFVEDWATYDTKTGGPFIGVAVPNPVRPFNAVFATTRRADDGPNDNALPLFLAAAVGMPEVNINTGAIATIFPLDGSANNCIIALDEFGDPGLEINGTVDLNAPNCNIQVNSCEESEATWIRGNSEVYLGLGDGAGSIVMCGTYRENGSVIIEGTIDEEVGPLPGDPVSLTAPAVPACDFGGDSGLPVYRWPVVDDDGNVEVLYPGVYCGGIDLGGAGGLVDPFITFCGVVPTDDCDGVPNDGTAANDAGLFIIKDGPLNFPGNAGVVGEGVTFYLTDSGDPYSLIDFRGTTNTMLNLSAPEPTYFAETNSSISLAGVLFWHDCGGTPEDCAAQTHNLRGTSGYGMAGLVYIPESKVYIRGTSDADGGDTDCLVLIANTIQMNGTTGLNVDNTCANYGLDDMFVADLRLRLVH